MGQRGWGELERKTAEAETFSVAARSIRGKRLTREGGDSSRSPAVFFEGLNVD
jgi:hypothetical protein